MDIPPALGQAWRHEQAWLAQLPMLIEACAEDWDLQLGEPFESSTSLVVPAGDAVLKLTAPSDRETDEEPDALEVWRGQGAVKLLARNGERRAYLIERCYPGTRLWDEEHQLLEVGVGLLSRLTMPVPAGHEFRSLRDKRHAGQRRRPDASTRPAARSSGRSSTTHAPSTQAHVTTAISQTRTSMAGTSSARSESPGSRSTRSRYRASEN